RVPGVSLMPQARVHSDGVLGMISMGKEEARSLMEKSREMADDISRRVASRALIFPTGGEVRAGLIKDLNSEFIASRLREEGYSVKVGEALEDEDLAIARAIQRAMDEGYGLLITTGGIGAEDKDRTVEGILRVIPEAAAPYIIRFTRGTGRHAKDGVRLAVGRAGASLVVALPGPHAEVRESVEVLLKGLKRGLSPSVLAFELAERLRRRMGSLMGGLPHLPESENKARG
ncbi:MAG: molybdopterin-binding protein, partial [Nitrospinota bacterium]